MCIATEIDQQPPMSLGRMRHRFRPPRVAMHWAMESGPSSEAQAPTPRNEIWTWNEYRTSFFERTMNHDIRRGYE